MELIAIAISLLVLWITSSRVTDVEKENQDIKGQLEKILKLLKDSSIPVVEDKPIIVTSRNEDSAKETELSVDWKTANSSEEKLISNTPSQSAEKSEPEISFEQRFGARLPVWIGGIALALAGIFMVKYSIEAGILTEKVRVILGGIFGAGLLCLSNWIAVQKNIANGEKISQTIAGAAIVDLYACMYATTSLYHFIPSFLGFAGMAAITMMAIVMSLRYGPPIAIFGLIGGFLTPALVSSSEPSAVALFIYLYIILVGLFTVIRKQNWWMLSIPTILAVFLWVVIWLATGFTSSDGLCLGLFLIAVCTTVILTSRSAMEDDKVGGVNLSPTINYLTLGGSALLMASVLGMSNFGFIEWGLFGLLALGSIVLAYLNQKLYGFAPLITAAISAIMLIEWQTVASSELAITIVSFASLYIAAGYFLMWKSTNQKLWAILVGVTSIGYYLIGYCKLHLVLSAFLTSNLNYWFANQPIWGEIALVGSFLAAQVTKKINSKFNKEEEIRQHLLAIFAIISTAFLSIACTIELQKEFLPIVFASQILAMSWINNRVDIVALPKIAQALFAIFVLLLTPQILVIFELVLCSLVGEAHGALSDLVMIKNPLIYFGIPALELVTASLFLTKQKDGAKQGGNDFVELLEAAAVILTTLASYYLVRSIFSVNINVLANKAGFVERGVITNVFCLYAVLCLWLGRKFNRNIILISGFAFLVTAILRIFYFDLIIYNPLLTGQSVGTIPILNALVLPYGLPVLALLFVNRELINLKDKFCLICNNIFVLVLLFALISLNIRQIYHGEYLNLMKASDAETYTYSVVWLLSGIALLFFGTLRKNKMIRVSSLVLVILAVGKVFLYDASELTGLYRVFSFLGLGISLIGLSWFYTRFISEEKPRVNQSI